MLGPLTAHEEGTSVVPTAGKPRQIFATLALNADCPVPISTLSKELWGESAPRSAVRTLQTYVMQLRHRIEAALADGDPRSAKDVLTTEGSAYRLAVSREQVDIARYERTAAQGRTAVAAGDDAAASALLNRALGLWRGPALVDVPVGRVLEAEALRWDEDRLATLEQRIDCDLRLGRHRELVPELRVLTARYPMDDRFCRHFMLALYRSGYTWRALEAYQRLRGELTAELGLRLPRDVERMQHLILSEDPELDLPGSVAHRERALLFA
ncbi:BTAD domain-containing putative transcriptional regulator [Streptomyces sp. NPDC058157]|uniref:AfsR/SARP family transcriptional regulator n=1 Tax=Streptomyces sp. NPDC058157 TaxID=3346360 RepID=UPI0036E02570